MVEFTGISDRDFVSISTVSTPCQLFIICVAAAFPRNHHSRLYLHTPPNKSGIVTVFVWQGMNLLRSCENFEFLLRSASTVVQIYQSVQQRLLALKILPPDSLASTH